MSQQIPEAYVRKYTAGIRILQQQMDQRLRSCVMVDDTVPGDRAFYDQIGNTEMTLVTNRHGATTYTDTPHSRRMVTMDMYDVSDLVDRADTRRLLNNPINRYSRVMAAAANRKFDKIIINAFNATASTGANGTGTAAFDSAYQFEADGSAAGTGGSALIIEGIIRARRALEAAENMEDGDDYRWCACLSARARADLLSETEVTSSDYNTVKALVNGQVDQFLGFTFTKSEQLNYISGTTPQLLPFWVKQSMQLGVSQDSRGFMDVLPQRRHSTQVRYEMDAGATRMDEKGVVLLEHLTT